MTSRDAKNMFLFKKSLMRPDKAKQGLLCQEQGPEHGKHVQKDFFSMHWDALGTIQLFDVIVTYSIATAIDLVRPWP